MKKLIIGLIVVLLLVPVSCAKLPAPEPEPRPLPAQPEIIDITITGYHSTHDIEGNYAPDRVEATFNWETKKPCYYYFEVRPVDFDYPSNSGGYEKLDVSAPLPEGVKHSWPIVLKSGKLHLYVLTVWDKEKNYFTKSDTFLAPVVPKAPPPPAPAPSPPPASSPGYPNHGIKTTNVEPRPGESGTIVSGSMVRYTIDDLVEKSDTVLIGKVVDIFPSRQVDRPPWIVITDVVIEVERYLYGQSQSTYITVMVPGGRTEEMVARVSDQPVFNLEEEVALFLYLQVSGITPPEGFERAEYYIVTGSIQGKPGYSDDIMVTWEGERFTVSEVEQKIASIHGGE